MYVFFENVIFLFFSCLLFFSAFFALCTRNIIHALLFLILSFLSFVFLLFLLECDFIAFVFLLIYVGAIAILFLFAIMLLNIKIKNSIKDILLDSPVGFLMAFLLLFQMFFSFGARFEFHAISSISDNLFYLNWYNLIEICSNIETFGLVLYFYCFIVFFVAWLLLNLIYFFSNFKKVRNAIFTHSNELEIIWTSIPALFRIVLTVCYKNNIPKLLFLILCFVPFVFLLFIIECDTNRFIIFIYNEKFYIVYWLIYAFFLTMQITRSHIHYHFIRNCKDKNSVLSRVVSSYLPPDIIILKTAAGGQIPAPEPNAATALPIGMLGNPQHQAHMNQIVQPLVNQAILGGVEVHPHEEMEVAMAMALFNLMNGVNGGGGTPANGGDN